MEHPSHRRRLITITIALVLVLLAGLPVRAQDDSDPPDIADVPSQLLTAGDDDHKQYFLIGTAEVTKAPADGYKLMLVLPGGNGNVDYSPFVRRMFKHAFDDSWLIAQLVAPVWSQSQSKSIVWPTQKLPHKDAKFTTEEFIETVVADVSGRTKIDVSRVFVLGWSSGGPLCYAATMRDGSSIKGAFVAMSVFKPQQIPALSEAKGKSFYLLQSPDDRVTPFRFAEQAKETLSAAGAKVRLVRYDGGHGWRGNVYGMLREGVEWLCGDE